MEAIIRYPNGRRSEVLVVSAGKFTMRIVSPGSVDTMELTCNYGEWTDEAGTPIQFESFVVSDADDVRAILNSTAARSAAVV